MGKAYAGFPSVSNELPRVRGATALNTPTADASTKVNEALQNCSVVVVAQTVAVISLPPGVNDAEEAPVHTEPCTSFSDTAACDTAPKPKAHATMTGAKSLEKFIYRIF